MTHSLTPQDHLALANRIRAAEAATRGEIYCVVARASGRYFFPAAFMLATGVMVASVAVALWLDRSWFAIGHLGFVLCQLAALAAALLVLRFTPGLAIRLAPRRLRYRRAHDNAVRQFLAHNVHLTEKRTGILIFVSLAERYATVIADAGIDDQVAQGDWDAIVARIVAAAEAGRLTEGLADGIDKAGALLAQHFPGGVRNPNELDDHVVEI
ncbi:MAG: TPM domain-containing protein [Aquamicrobium sp.]|nr:TPM domain-containing protein [Aquamicrobium sp.]